MSSHVHAQVKSASSSALAFTPTPSKLPQRKYGCSGTPGMDGMCETYRQKRLVRENLSLVQTKFKVDEPNDKFGQKALVQGLQSGGQLLPAPTRHFFEPRIGYGFNQMRIYPTTPGAIQTKSVTGRSLAVQCQSATAPPEEIVREEAAAPPTEGPATSGNIPDTGDAVASIEAGAPFGDSTNMEEDEDVPVAMQAKTTDQGGTSGPALSPQAVLGHLGSGVPMGKALRGEMEGYFGVPFGAVRLHTDAGAARLATSLGAQAFTVGNNIAFAAGHYRPDSGKGRELIAHELTHVTQQRRGLSGDIVRSGIGTPGDRYEQEADKITAGIGGDNPQAAAFMPASASQRPGLSRKAVMQLYSGSKAANYASKWALGTNRSYGRMSNDCTNFVSQALYEGGWKMIFGKNQCEERKNNDVWWFLRDGCMRFIRSNIHASHTWGGAHNLYKHMATSGRGTLAQRAADLNEGDVLQMDFTGSGHIQHTMMVTKKVNGNLYLSYHTSDHLNEPLWDDGPKKGILSRKPDPPTKYYGWKVS